MSTVVSFEHAVRRFRISLEVIKLVILKNNVSLSCLYDSTYQYSQSAEGGADGLQIVLSASGRFNIFVP